MKKIFFLSLILSISMISLNAQFQVPNTNIYYNNGNLGIGISTPYSTLSIRNSLLNNDATTGAVDLFFSTASDGKSGTKISTFKESFNTAGLAFYTQHGYRGVYERMRISSIGRVSIGLETTNATLSIRNTLLDDNATAGVVDMFFSTTLDGKSGTKISTFKESFNTAGLAFYTQHGYGGIYERMRISSIGRVSIGLETTNATLSIRNTLLDDNATAGVVDMFFSTTWDGKSGTKISTFKESFNTAGLAFYTQHGYGGIYERMRISAWGNVGIGTTTPAYKLDVCGEIRAKEIKVEMIGCDFVFEDGYRLMPIDELALFVKEKKHLPEIASAKEMEANGTDLGRLNSQLLQKVEELTLYTIELNKEIREMKTQNDKIEKLEEQVQTLLHQLNQSK